MFLLPVSLTRMGYSNTRSKEPDQPNVDSQPFKENYSFRGFEASMDLRMYKFLLIYTFVEEGSLTNFYFCGCLSHTKFWLENLQGRDHLEVLVVDGRIMLKFGLEKCTVRMWTRYIQLRIRALGNSCEHSNELLFSKKGTTFFVRLSDCQLFILSRTFFLLLYNTERYSGTIIFLA